MLPGTPTRLTVIIPVHGETERVLKCLKSLEESSQIEPIRVIVVDDASPDQTPDRVAQQFPNVSLVRRNINGGFAAACNSGYAAVDPNCPFIALLNSDTVVDIHWAAKAIAALERNPGVACIAPRMMALDQPNVIDSMGLTYTISGWAFRRGHGRTYQSAHDQPQTVFGATGGALVLRRSALHEPLFRESLVCYYEDVELAMRLRRDGWTCLYVPDSIVHHADSVSYAKRSAVKAFHVSRNLELLFWEYTARRDLWRAFPAHAALVVIHSLIYWWRGQFGPFFRGKLAAWRQRRSGRVQDDCDRRAARSSLERQ